jgi:hypothetical protein
MKPIPRTFRRPGAFAPAVVLLGFAACAAPRHVAVAPATLPAASGPAAAGLAGNAPAVAQSQPALRSDLAPPSAELEDLAERLSKKVEEARNLHFAAPVKKGVLDEEGLREQLDREFEEDVKPDELEAKEIAFELMGLIPAGSDLTQLERELLLSGLGGFYDAKRKQLFLLESTAGSPEAATALAHELCHALDDQHFDLESLDDQLEEAAPHNDDRAFALGALTEGSATAIEFALGLDPEMADEGSRVEADAMGGDEGDSEMEAEADDEAAAAEDMGAVEEDPTFPEILIRPLMEQYIGGHRFLAKETWPFLPRVDTDSIDAAFANPPLSSEQILHPEKYWDPARRDDPKEIILPDLTKSLGAGWRKVGENVLGELGVAILTTPSPSEERDDSPRFAPTIPEALRQSTPEAEGWGGDLYVVYRGPGDAKLVVWASVWDSEDDAQEMMIGLRAPKGVSLARKMRADRLVAVFATGVADEDRLKTLANDALLGIQLRAPKPIHSKHQ